MHALIGDLWPYYDNYESMGVGVFENWERCCNFDKEDMCSLRA